MNLNTAYLILGSVLICSLIVGILVSIHEKRNQASSDEPELIRILEATQKMDALDYSPKSDTDTPVIIHTEPIEILDL